MAFTQRAFDDRDDAGRRLGRRLARGGEADKEPIVLALPRGGVPVGHRVAEELGAPLDIIAVRKLGLPGHEELAMGAIGEGGVRILNDEVVRGHAVGEEALQAVERSERAELERRAALFREGRPRTSPAGRTAVVVDDGVATGSTARAACRVARAQGAVRVVLAVPVGAPTALRSLARDADEVVCLTAPEWFQAVGEWYADFAQTTDEEVIGLLREHSGPAGPGADAEVEVEAAGVRLEGHLTVPEGALGTVVFAHGSGSGRHSPRNVRVAGALNGAGLGTLLFDLLTEEEGDDRGLVFDIRLLAERLRGAAEWLRARPEAAHLPTGYFGASTGAAAALVAAADAPSGTAAVVSRGGRPDLAGARLAEVRAPTLLIVGGADTAVLDLNRRAQEEIACESALEVVPGSGHLFEEPGALDRVAELAADWFVRHLRPGAEA
ncbi:phosphoribosyltransferase family protein [Nocardiopsis sp. RSe5-2]|uniref:Phosphoribosyltransferase family protein n=1 Tax=Nocardiopsis endophytica TaxID=3018445 RepID=A0ABT4U469_9ACTN|nr:phosphoribosyltransferase family protein [Nocardiopsis endophytica]MDA2811506.1 phosphoribosyltransferase family protein [Nocardiopsis endophytica]